MSSKVAKKKIWKGSWFKQYSSNLFLKKPSDNMLTSSIPLDMADMAMIRKPIKREELAEIVATLEKKAKKVPLVVDLLKEELVNNDAKTTARVLKKLWIDKMDKSTSFSPTKKRIYEKVFRALMEEFALIRKTTIEKAEEKIISSLEKSI